MRCRLALAALCLVALAGPVTAQSFRVVDAFQEDGAYSLIVVPEEWNGGLFIYAHGYSPDQRTIVPYPTDLTPENIGTRLTGGDQLLQIPVSFGYAAATTTYRSVGWAVQDAIKDIENIRRRFVRRYGKPTLTYIWGHSEGGMVTQAVLEVASPHYAGALPFCAPGAGARRNFNGAFDLRAVFEHVCRDVPGARFLCNVCSGGRARCLGDGDCPDGETCGGPEPAPPPEHGLTRECTEFLLGSPDNVNEMPQYDDFVGRVFTACFGGDAPTPEQAARRDLYLRTTRIPESFLATDLFFASVGIAEVFHRRTGGKVPWGNLDIAYSSPELTAAEAAAINAGVPRAEAQASAVKYMRRFFEPRAKTEAKVLTLHALDDGLVIPENTEKYAEAFAAAGRSQQLVQIYTPTGGHCGFSGAEHLAMFFGLTDWVERGVVPSAGRAQTLCRTFEGLAGGPCRLSDQTPGEWGLRVVERQQKGAPPQTLVCSGDQGDCPLGWTCDLDTLHCR
jgi:hypothetical protein